MFTIYYKSNKTREGETNSYTRTSKLSTLLCNINTLSIAVALNRALMLFEGDAKECLIVDVFFLFSSHNPCSLFHFLRTVIGESGSSFSSSSHSPSFFLFVTSPNGVRWRWWWWLCPSLPTTAKETVFFFGTAITALDFLIFCIDICVCISERERERKKWLSFPPFFLKSY